MKNYLIFILLVITAVFTSCTNNSSTKKKTIDTSITSANSFNELFLDSIQLENFIKEQTELKVFTEQYQDFYADRNYEFAWFDKAGANQHTLDFLNLLATTVADLQDSSLFTKSYLSIQQNIEVIDTLEIQAKKELIITGQFFRFATKMYKGSNINTKDLGWYIPRKKIDLKAFLQSTLEPDSTITQQFALLNQQYKKLQANIALYHNIAKKYDWKVLVVPKKSIKPKDSSVIIPYIKQKLQLLGDAVSKDTSIYYDSVLLIAIQSFQQRMGLTPNGVIGKQVIDELNVLPNKRIQQILINLERMRWMPPQQNTAYILVNIPEYKMHVIHDGKQQFEMNVIVGTATHNTVIFSGKLQNIVFSPYWNVPSSIVASEIAPAMRRNKNYISNKNMEITGYSNGLPIVRQKPGKNNSLGLVKFLFPNSHSIYFHDTPNRNLFSETKRSFSHGCIRLAEPKKFAQYLLRADTATIWKSHIIDSVMNLTTEKWVTLKQPIPVLIAYFTAWVDVNGKLNFRKDIYKHDEKLAAKLFSAE
jgi:murein L,D-transpeptidase YcbB/YkuD